MKKKIIIILIIGILSTLYIYINNKEEKIYFLSLGDGLATGMTSYQVNGYNFNDYIRDYLETKSNLEDYVHEFSKENQTIENLITSIENNYQVEGSGLTIQQSLAKANLTTVAIGIDELARMSLKQVIPTKEKENFKKNMAKLLKLIRNFNDEQIYLLGIYKVYNLKEEDVKDINQYFQKLAIDYQVIYLDIADLIKHEEYFSSNDSYYLNYKGHKDIYNRIQKDFVI